MAQHPLTPPPSFSGALTRGDHTTSERLAQKIAQTSMMMKAAIQDVSEAFNEIKFLEPTHNFDIDDQTHYAAHPKHAMTAPPSTADRHASWDGNHPHKTPNPYGVLGGYIQITQKLPEDEWKNTDAELDDEIIKAVAWGLYYNIFAPNPDNEEGLDPNAIHAIVEMCSSETGGLYEPDVSTQVKTTNSNLLDTEDRRKNIVFQQFVFFLKSTLPDTIATKVIHETLGLSEHDLAEMEKTAQNTEPWGNDVAKAIDKPAPALLGPERV